MDKTSRIYVAGHTGLAGSALARQLRRRGYGNLVVRTHAELELAERAKVREFFQRERPDCVFLAAARAGGILANSTYPADFIRENLEIQINVIEEARRAGVKRLLFLAASCIYPRDSPQPMREASLLTGPVEFTNRPYALAKIAGIEMCWACNRQYGTSYRVAVPNNLYGPGDGYDPEQSHVLPALIRKFHEAKARSSSRLAPHPSSHADALHRVGRSPARTHAGASIETPDSLPHPSQGDKVVLWGTGTPRREMLYSDDMAEACVTIMELPDATFDTLVGTQDSAPGSSPGLSTFRTQDSNSNPPLINIGWGEDYTIRELAERVRDTIGFQGKIEWDSSKPDGAPRKLLDVSRMKALGWSPRTPLEEGLKKAYEDFLARFAA